MIVCVLCISFALVSGVGATTHATVMLHREAAVIGNKIKLGKDLLDKAKKFALEEGYSSVEELIGHLLEEAIANSKECDTDDASDDDLKKRLEGLGYIS